MLCQARLMWRQCAAGRRNFSSAGSLVDQVIAYTRSLQGQDDQAVDVLRSALSTMQQQGGNGQEHARLLLALAEAASLRCDWARSLLAAGWDNDVRQVADWACGSNAASAVALAVLTALGQWDEAGQAAAQTTCELSAAAGSSAQAHSLMNSFAVKALANFSHSQGADKLCTRAANEAAQAAKAAGSLPGPISPALALELEADAHMGSAQVAIASRQWDAAEESLSSALRAAEGAAGDKAPMLAAPLMLLGWVYSRSARVTYGEGLFREAAKLACLDPARGASMGSSTHAALHDSMAAALAWRYCQLLTALPKRSSEAEAWGRLAHAYWERGCSYMHSNGGSHAQLEGVLGDITCLTGKGSHGSGALVSLFLRRLIPMVDAGAQHA